MNSKDYRNIREAYLQVYAPQELTEEQVWEGVENWVQSLLEEGYDLSDYTWEEMYESYLEEGPYSADSVKAAQQAAQAGQVKRDAAAVALKTQRRSQDVADYRKAMLPAPVKKNTMDGRYQDPKTQKIIPKAVVKPAGNPPLSDKPPTPTPTASRPTPTPTAPRPTATPTPSSGHKSTPTTPTTPTTAPKPAIGTTPGGTKFERRTPTSAELSAAQDARAAGKGEEGAIKAGVEASKPAPPAPAAASPTPSGESDRLKKALDIKKSDVTSGFDMFDVVKGYLIGEGYADTEEAALAIMANMSEDWKYSIMEQQISSVSANAPSGVKKPTVTASISAGGKTPPGQKMLDKAGQMLSGKGPSNNFGRGF